MQAKDYHVYDELKDGRKVLIRAVRPEDGVHLQDGLNRLSNRSAYMRFHTPKKSLNKKELSYLTELDFDHHVGIGAVLLDNHKLQAIGVARYVTFGEESPKKADIAFTVHDDFQGLGIGTLLLKHLVILAEEKSVAILEAIVLNENIAMLRILEKSGLKINKRVDGRETVLSIQMN